MTSRVLPFALLHLLVLGACASSPAPTPVQATVPAPAVAPPGPAAPAAPPDIWTDFIESLPKARSRTGKYELGLAMIRQVPHGDGSVAIELQAQLTTQAPDVLLDRVDKPVRRLVMNDGTELSYPEQLSLGMPHRGHIAAHGMDVFHEHSGVWDLVIDAAVIEVLRWQEFVIPSVAPGSHEGLAMGPFDVGIDAQSDALSVGFFSIEGRRFDAWVATLTQPVLKLVTHRFAAAALEVTDASGRALVNRGGGGSGGSTSVQLRYDTPGPIAYPVRLRLRLPVRYQMEMSAFRWRDLPLLPLQR